MVIGALKMRPAPVAKSSAVPACPAEACLREWAAEERLWKAMRKSSTVKWPDEEPAYAAYIERRAEILERATYQVAKSLTGAAFQALLLYGASPIHKDNEPAGLTEAQKEPFADHEATVTRISLSLFRLLSGGINDRDLNLFSAEIRACDSWAKVFDDAGLNLMEAL